MRHTERLSNQLAEYVAAGEPDAWRYRRLRAHIQRCPHCQARLESLRYVEQALRTWPSHVPQRSLLPKILQAVSEEAVQNEDWQLLPWNIWVPIVAVGAALLIAAISLPPSSLATETISSWEKVLGGSSTVTLVWDGTHELPWAVWTGVVAVAAGLGTAFGFSERISLLQPFEMARAYLSGWIDRLVALAQRAERV